jgi:hypothetical protein
VVGQASTFVAGALIAALTLGGLLVVRIRMPELGAVHGGEHG